MRWMAFLEGLQDIRAAGHPVLEEELNSLGHGLVAETLVLQQALREEARAYFESV